MTMYNELARLYAELIDRQNRFMANLVDFIEEKGLKNEYFEWLLKRKSLKQTLRGKNEN